MSHQQKAVKNHNIKTANTLKIHQIQISGNKISKSNVHT